MRTLKMVFRHQLITEFMQSADMFESFKVLVMPTVIASVKDDWNKNNLEAILKINSNEFPIVAIVETVDDKNIIHYQDETVKAVSTGDRWCVLDDYLAAI